MLNDRRLARLTAFPRARGKAEDLGLHPAPLQRAREDIGARDKFLSIMHDQTERMRRLIDDLLSLSRVEMDEHLPPNDEVDIVVNLKR